MTTLPTAATFQAEPMDGWTLSNGLVALRDFLAQHLGTAGTPAEALGALGALVAGVQTATAARSVASGDRGRAILASGTWTLALGAAATLGPGFAVLVVNTGSGTITLDPNASEQIDGAATAALGPGRAALVLCDGTAWRSLALPGTAAGQTLVGAGTAANPGLAFAGDADTGLWLPNADAVGIAAGGAERVRVTAAGMQVTGNITGTAVMQGPTDATAGRVVRLFSGSGAFGLGLDNATLNLPPSNNADALRMSGIYRYTTDTIGRPNPNGVLLHFTRLAGQGAGFHIQFALPRDSGLRLQRRVMLDNTGAWDDWDGIYSQRTILGTVSQSAGVPTGAVIERGSNANGEYVRFADGTLICTRTLTASASAATTWTFPSAFAAAPVVCGAAVATVLAAVCLDSAPTATSVALSVRDSANARRADSVRLTAIGRWF
ncbi:MAG: hypothetical protein ACK4OP_09085 [Gemmobacter sp.]